MPITFVQEQEVWSRGLPVDQWAKAREACAKYYERLSMDQNLFPLLDPILKAVPIHEDEIKLAGSLAMFIAGLLGWENDSILQRQCYGIFLQNIGLIDAPETMDLIPPAMSPNQLEVYNKHPQKGVMMLEGRPQVHETVRQIVHQHHECFDGSGSPNGLSAGRIYAPARLATFVTEVAEVMVRQSVSSVEAVRKLIAMEGKAAHYDPNYIRTFLECLASKR